MGMPDIDDNKLYTVDECARKVMELFPDLTYEKAYKMVCDGIDSGALPSVGTLDHLNKCFKGKP